MINFIYKREQGKLESVRTLLNAYDKGNISRERMEAGLCHLFLPLLSWRIKLPYKVRNKSEELLKPAPR